MKTHNTLQDPDRFYDELNDAHLDLDGAQSAALNARLVLILANQIGDAALLSECVQLAARCAAEPVSAPAAEPAGGASSQPIPEPALR
ncbi:MAG: DUF2783 domain-containing protein [Burkholderiales bacterium]|nr:DUF2783 domain-containing protein [Burkholderiales bacterium]